MASLEQGNSEGCGGHPSKGPSAGLRMLIIETDSRGRFGDIRELKAIDFGGKLDVRGEMDELWLTPSVHSQTTG